MAKKGVKILLLVFAAVIAVSLIHTVSAQDSIGYILQKGAENFISWTTSFLKPFFVVILGSYSTDEFFFMKVLVFLLLFFVIRAGLGSVPKLGENKFIAIIIALTISILATRFMSENDLFKGILLPYTVLGITLTTLIPFFVMFFILHWSGMQGLGRRLTWMAFGAIFIVLFITRYDQLPQTGKYIYYALLGLIVFAFMFDRAFHRYFFMHELNLFYKGANQKAVAALQAEYINLVNVDSPQANARRANIEENLKRLGANVP